MTRTELGLVTAAAILIAAAGCQAHHHPANHAKAEASQSDADTVEQMGKDIQADADKTEKEMEADTDDARDRLDRDMADANAEADKAAQRAEGDLEHATDAGQAEADRAAKSAEGDLDRATAPLEGTKTDKPVRAEVEKVDRDQGLVTFYLKESRDEIQLQAGHEITVRFDQLQDLTGLEEQDALDAMSEGKDFEVQVVGVGDAMKITRIAVPKPK
jgi:hypothetical protein